MRYLTVLVHFLLLLPILSFSQKIDNTASYRSIGTDNYFRFSYDNDYFTATDYFYTQGYSFELAAPSLKKNPLTKLLVKLSDSTVVNGLALEHYGFTPTSIRHDEILLNDRPFAACIMLKTFMVSTNVKKKEQLSTILSTGMIGPAAFGGGMQKTIHRWIGGVEPKGWQHQIKNDIILNYELNHEKLLIDKRYVSANSVVNLRLGTISDKIQTGATFTLGKYTSSLKGLKQSPFQFYIYTQPLVNLIAYDATLQGTLFNKSPYTLRASEITRVNLQNNFGVVLKIRKVYLEYNRAVLGKEFKSGKIHRWGGIRLGFVI